MRLYDFIEIESERQEFIYCIFEVGEWYVDNVYTYQGAHKVKSEIDAMSKAASDNAKNIWKKKRASFNDTEFVMDATSDDKNDDNIYTNNDAIYDCDLFIDYDKREVVDDCSKFVTAVYYHYLKKKSSDTSDFDLLYTGSSQYISHISKIINILTKKNLFTLYTHFDIMQYLLSTVSNTKNIFYELQVGDMIYRPALIENHIVIKPAHIEFYIGNNSVISWGRVHSEYITKKILKYNNGVYISNSSLDFNQPYIHIIRFNGENYEQEYK